MTKDILLLKPIKENQPEFIKTISTIFNMDIQLVQQLADYFKDDFYLILSLFANQNIKFPSVKELSELNIKINIYKDFKEGIKTLQLNDLLEILSSRYKCSSNQCFQIHKELKDMLGE